MMAPAGPFPLMCVAYALVGFGLSLQNAHYNAFVASSKENAPTKIGILLAAYGEYATVPTEEFRLTVKQGWVLSWPRLFPRISRSRNIGRITSSSLPGCTH